jgi:hypothetical protein
MNGPKEKVPPDSEGLTTRAPRVVVGAAALTMTLTLFVVGIDWSVFPELSVY